MAKFYVSRGGRRIYTSKSDFRRRNDLPYGLWVCGDGREVLYNRGYEPIWQRLPGGTPTMVDPREWVPWQEQSWFYHDEMSDRQKTIRGEAVLKQWGIALP
jgi:hypothetical protein